jgi:flagellar motor switch protein FliG
MLALGESEAAEVMKLPRPARSAQAGRGDGADEGRAARGSGERADDFRERVDLQSTVGLDSDEYIRQVLTKALGDDKAAVLLNRILGGKDASGIESLKWMDSPRWRN